MGYRDREWLRVHPLCANLPAAHKTDHASWEDTYYPDVIEDALAQRAQWRAVGDPRGGVNVPRNEQVEYGRHMNGGKE